MLTEIDHVAIAVNDLEAGIAYYRDTYGAEVEHREVVERDGVEEALLKVAESYVQLLTPVRDDSPVAKYLEKKGEGLHHVGQAVADERLLVVRVRAPEVGQPRLADLAVITPLGPRVADFGAQAGPDRRGYYSFDYDGWHFISLNSLVDVSLRSEQYVWLAADLAKSKDSLCTIAYWHYPAFNSGAQYGSSGSVPTRIA